MTIIAWDGKSLAVDKLACCNGLGVALKKYKVLASGEVTVWAGNHEQGLVLTEWYEKGAKKKDWPEFQRSADWTTFVIAGPQGIKEYEQEPVAQYMDEKIMAWGSGRNYALGAMAMGATAEKSVLVASLFDLYCGKGVEVFHF